MLSGKVALVTGGSRGIGQGIAKALGEANIKVAITYRTNREKALQVSKEIESQGGVSLAFPMRLEERGSVEEAINKINRRMGSIDILINNAATSQEKHFETLTDQDWNNMLSINLVGPSRCCQIVLPEMLKKGWGRIINIVSIGGQWGGFRQVHYAASKAALINLTRSLARLYSNCGITANAISPGLVATDMTRSELDGEEGRNKVKSIPCQRLGTPQEIGAAARFLVSHEAGYITGQTINLNGGMYFV